MIIREVIPLRVLFHIIVDIWCLHLKQQAVGVSVTQLCLVAISSFDLVIPKAVHDVFAYVQHSLANVDWTAELELAFCAMDRREISTEYSEVPER
jgi:hypothetical protein